MDAGTETANKERLISIEEYKAENIRLRNEIIYLREQLELLKQKLFGTKSEKRQDDSPTLFGEDEIKAAEKEEAAQTETITYERRKPTGKKGRKPIPEWIPRQDVIIDIPEEEKKCACGCELKKIGEDVSERIEIKDPEITVIREIRPKYVCQHCHGETEPDKPAVREMPATPSVVPGGIVTARTIAFILCWKYLDAMPFYRLEKHFHRYGIPISRQDMVNWQQKVANVLKPLLELLKEELKKGPVLRMDETTVQVMGEEGRADTTKSYMWLARGGPPGHGVCIFEYHPTRGSEHIDIFLKGFSGHLQTDGYSGYDAAVKLYPEVKHVGCFAHARRKFVEAEKAGSRKTNENAKSAAIGIKYIRQLYEIEGKTRAKMSDDKLTLEQFAKLRQEEVAPVFAKFKKWLDNKVKHIDTDTLIGKAVFYAWNQWDKLTRYVESPYLTPDNNTSENAIRPFVIGRKNWMFYQNPESAESGCLIYSLLETAKLNGLNPNKYLGYVIDKAPTTTDWARLLPWNVKTETGAN